MKKKYGLTTMHQAQGKWITTMHQAQGKPIVFCYRRIQGAMLKSSYQSQRPHT